MTCLCKSHPHFFVGLVFYRVVFEVAFFPQVSSCNWSAGQVWVPGRFFRAGQGLFCRLTRINCSLTFSWALVLGRDHKNPCWQSDYRQKSPHHPMIGLV